MTVDELVGLISNEDGEIYPFSYSANMMQAYGVNEKLVRYFHDAAASANRDSYDRGAILSEFREFDEAAGRQAAHNSFVRNNPHVKKFQ